MGKEIERKFLVKNKDFQKDAKAILIRQGYLSDRIDTAVRVRVMGEEAFLTIKSKGNGITREEYEYAIPHADAMTMLEHLCIGYILEKTRYTLFDQQMLWTVDEFHGANAGLLLAEIELESENQPFKKPDWVGEEITFDFRFAGSNLAVKPFTLW